MANPTEEVAAGNVNVVLPSILSVIAGKEIVCPDGVAVAVGVRVSVGVLVGVAVEVGVAVGPPMIIDVVTAGAATYVKPPLVPPA